MSDDISEVELATVEALLGKPTSAGGRFNATPAFVARLIRALRRERLAREVAESAVLTLGRTSRIATVVLDAEAIA